MKKLLMAAALLPLAACQTMADGDMDMAGDMDRRPMADGGPMAADPMAMPTTASGYLMMASASDKYEMESSMLALEKSRDPAIRAFAQEMINDHRQTSQTLALSARASGMTPPEPMLNAMQQRDIAELRAAAPGAAFDAAYVRQQRLAHEIAVALHTRYSASGDTPGLRAAAAKAVPIVTEHLRDSRALPMM